MKELSKTFDPKTNEKLILKAWEDRFVADSSSSRPSYSIIIPPPNVTGKLHMGHACDASIQDALIRFHRMEGYETLWFPGTDHAGIATQTVVERMLIKEFNKRRIDLTKEEFLEHAFRWKDEYEASILSQFKRLGSSCDWTRLRFTMDPVCSKTVREVFKRMFDDGLIYRGLYLVNWDPVSETALADDEVEYEEIDTGLYHFTFHLTDKSGSIVVATTRPETMLADVAIAVHPDDERYKEMIGKTYYHPMNQQQLPIIADHFVIKEFGTGAVKITPAHDARDYQVAKRHGLQMPNMMTSDGKVIEGFDPFSGLQMLEAREKITEAMQKLGQFLKKETYLQKVGFSYRSKARIEPYLSKQWFVKMTHFKERLISMVANKEVMIIPPEWEKTYFHWIENLHDWCISRQLWWGHEIPVWYDLEDETNILCHIGDNVPKEVENNPSRYRKETDVLDTWFSSALWPFCTTQWVDGAKEYQKFFPTSVLVTGHDILFFWVARMLLMSEYLTQKSPFEKVFLHGLIYAKSYWREPLPGQIAYVSSKERQELELMDKLPKEIHFKWEKMSKSKGNVIDPIEMIEQYGIDAVRFTLLSLVTHARQIDLDQRRFEEGKNFINKIWNAFRFSWSHLETLSSIPTINESLLMQEDRWILNQLSKLATTIRSSFQGFHFDLLCQSLYQFFWDEFCSIYLELLKPYLFKKVGTTEIQENKKALLFHLIHDLILLMHPMIPFISEELYHYLKSHFSLEFSLAAHATMPSPKPYFDTESFNITIESIRIIRNMRAEMQMPLGLEPHLYIEIANDDPNLETITEGLQSIKTLAKLSNITLIESEASLSSTSLAKTSFKTFTLHLPLPEEMREKERQRLQKELVKTSSQLDGLKNRLLNPDFIAKAPQHLIEEVRTQEKEMMQKVEKIAIQLATL